MNFEGIRQSGGLLGPDGQVTHYVITSDPENPVVIFGSEERPGASPVYVEELLHALHHPYHVAKPEAGWRSIDSFTAQEKEKLRPIAETLAMLDGNAFFDMDSGEHEHYEYYLAEAASLYEGNGGDQGWAGLASFAKGKHSHQE